MKYYFSEFSDIFLWFLWSLHFFTSFLLISLEWKNSLVFSLCCSLQVIGSSLLCIPWRTQVGHFSLEDEEVVTTKSRGAGKKANIVVIVTQNQVLHFHSILRIQNWVTHTGFSHAEDVDVYFGKWNLQHKLLLNTDDQTLYYFPYNFGFLQS